MVCGNVHCYSCGADFELYIDSLPTPTREVYVTCPHCSAVMPPRAADKLFNAFMVLEEANKTLRVAHEEKGASLFQVELRNHYVSTKTLAQIIVAADEF